MDKILCIGLAVILCMLIVGLAYVNYGVDKAIIECTTESITEEPTETEPESFPVFIETIRQQEETSEAPGTDTDIVPETAVETTTVENEAATEPETTQEERYYYDVPLDHDIQDYIFEKCEEYNLDPTIVIGLIRQESLFLPYVIGDNGNSYGLMQINKKWHVERMKKLGVTDLLDPCQNIAVGIDILGELYAYKGNIKWALMAYNGGYEYADRWYDKGKFSVYVEVILEYSEILKNERGDVH